MGGPVTGWGAGEDEEERESGAAPVEDCLRSGFLRVGIVPVLGASGIGDGGESGAGLEGSGHWRSRSRKGAQKYSAWMTELA